ncbi:uncharacterized protein [Atheta coriaria]|uniref:uncharacterized protein n=1 Tax=Dalotia coriaria TaxID=877792 RepID=UPI0031F4211E
MAVSLSVILVISLILIETSCGEMASVEHKMQSDLENVLSHMRMVVRTGIKVKGTYSFSDGEVRKTIYYIADNKGYRITGEDVVPVKDNQPVRIYPFPDDNLQESELSQGSKHTQSSPSSLNPT